MLIRKAEGTLTKTEKPIIKGLLARGWRNQDIQALVNVHRRATINSARITEVKNDSSVKAANDDDLDFYIRKKKAYDPHTGLNLFDDERLLRAREAMILAVQAFNNPGLRFKTEVFSVLANIAWTYLLHEYYQRKGIKIINDDGLSLLLSQMLQREDCPLSQGIKNNMTDVKKIRDTVEHQLLGRADYKFFPLFQACCLNFDKTLCALFGNNLSLSNELSLALQFAKLEFEQLVELEKHDIPPQIKALDASLQQSHTEAELADLEYQFKVIYTLQSAAKSRAHIQFVRPDSAEGKEICNVLEKRVISDALYPYKPTDVCKLVMKETKKKFTVHNHSQALSLFKIRPKGNNPQPENTNKDYCIYHPIYKSYSYSESWIGRLCDLVASSEEFDKIKSHKI
ncbi:MAG: DUF3644 domain-containing protein [Alphaproteobacteria bacterium]